MIDRPFEGLLYLKVGPFLVRLVFYGLLQLCQAEEIHVSILLLVVLVRAFGELECVKRAVRGGMSGGEVGGVLAGGLSVHFRPLCRPRCFVQWLAFQDVAVGQDHVGRSREEAGAAMRCGARLLGCDGFRELAQARSRRACPSNARLATPGHVKASLPSRPRSASSASSAWLSTCLSAYLLSPSRRICAQGVVRVHHCTTEKKTSRDIFTKRTR